MDSIPTQETRIERAIEGYQQGRYPSLSAAAKALEVPPSTVRHRAAGRKPVLETATRLAMDTREEKALVDWVFQLHRLQENGQGVHLRFHYRVESELNYC